jgi:phage shock protein A
MNKLLRRLKGGLDALLAPAEDPRLVFASAEQRQQLLLALARRALAELAATRRQLDARKLAIQEHLPRLEQQAQRALAAGREDLARVALRRRHIAAAELKLLDQHAQELLAKEQMLALHEERLAAQVEAFQARLQLISASYSAAEVQVRMNEALSGVSEEMTQLSQAWSRLSSKPSICKRTLQRSKRWCGTARPSEGPPRRATARASATCCWPKTRWSKLRSQRSGSDCRAPAPLEIFDECNRCECYLRRP